MSASLSLGPAECNQTLVSSHPMLPAGRSSHVVAATPVCRGCWDVVALQFNYQYKQLISATIVAGWDKSEGGQVSHNTQTFSSH